MTLLTYALLVFLLVFSILLGVFCLLRIDTVLVTVRWIKSRLNYPESFTIYQTETRYDHALTTYIRRFFQMATPNGVSAGGQGTFQATPNPSGAQLAAGVVPSWTASDPSIVLTQNGLVCVAAVPAGSTLTSFTLNISATNPDGTVAQGSASVPVLPPPPPEPTSFTVSQIA